MNPPIIMLAPPGIIATASLKEVVLILKLLEGCGAG